MRAAHAARGAQNLRALGAGGRMGGLPAARARKGVPTNVIISSQPAHSAMIISSQRAYSAVTAAHTCRRNRLSRALGADLQITFVVDRDPVTRGWRRIADHLRAAGPGENLSASRSRPGC
jgi:hypothetical protein